MPEYIWGRNPVLETLHSPRKVKRLLLAEGLHEAPALATILQEAERRQIPIETVSRQRLDQLSLGPFTRAAWRWSRPVATPHLMKSCPSRVGSMKSLFCCYST